MEKELAKLSKEKETIKINHEDHLNNNIDLNNNNKKIKKDENLNYNLSVSKSNRTNIKSSKSFSLRSNKIENGTTLSPVKEIENGDLNHKITQKDFQNNIILKQNDKIISRNNSKTISPLAVSRPIKTIANKQTSILTQKTKLSSETQQKHFNKTSTNKIPIIVKKSQENNMSKSAIVQNKNNRITKHGSTPPLNKEENTGEKSLLIANLNQTTNPQLITAMNRVIATRLGIDFNDQSIEKIAQKLMSGVILCKLINKIRPQTISNILEVSANEVINYKIFVKKF